MISSDDDNLLLLDKPEPIDQVNRRFYNRFPYPWAPMSFPQVEDESLATIMLNQDIGDWRHTTTPEGRSL